MRKLSKILLTVMLIVAGMSESKLLEGLAQDVEVCSRRRPINQDGDIPGYVREIREPSPWQSLPT